MSENAGVFVACASGETRLDDAPRTYREVRTAHWNRVALAREKSGRGAAGYHRRLEQIYRNAIPPGLRVLELGCGEGDLLAAVRPATGVGVDFSEEMVRQARAKHAALTFVCADALEWRTEETFDVVILSDLVQDVWDIQTVLERVRAACHPRTRVVLNLFSKLWELPLSAARAAGLATPLLEQNWITIDDMANVFRLAGFEVVRRWEEVLWPFRTPLIAPFFNRFFVRLPIFRLFALTNVFVARPLPTDEEARKPGVVSVIVPARNESGNIAAIFDRVPQMGAGTELVFVEGHSTDDTWSVIEREIAAHPDWRSQAVQQSGTGKGDAVRLGFARATGEYLMILDADLTMPPELLPRYYEALRSGVAEFVNGVRLVYPMERQAMRFLNLVANKLFGIGFSWLLGQPIRDTLCGTKALRRSDYELIARNRDYFGDFDPFGDFDLLLGAARLNLKIVDLPVRYRERTYGTTNIRRFRHGLLLLRMALFAARRLKFV